jgi:hypothetical protein
VRFVLTLLLVGAGVFAWGWLCFRIAFFREARLQRPRSGGDLRGRSLGAPALPAGHRAPPGLGPLSPSERFLTQEAARGLRELERYLAEQPAR